VTHTHLRALNLFAMASSPVIRVLRVTCVHQVYSRNTNPISPFISDGRRHRHENRHLHIGASILTIRECSVAGDTQQIHGICWHFLSNISITDADSFPPIFLHQVASTAALLSIQKKSCMDWVRSKGTPVKILCNTRKVDGRPERPLFLFTRSYVLNAHGGAHGACVPCQIACGSEEGRGGEHQSLVRIEHFHTQGVSVECAEQGCVMCVCACVRVCVRV